MKTVSARLVLVLSFAAASCSTFAENSPEAFGTPYPGGTPPSVVAKVFAPGLVNTEENREIEGMYGATMDTYYFVKRPLGTESSANIFTVITFKDGQWHEEGVKNGVSEPSISPDGTTIYFSNDYVERTKDGWSELKALGAPFDDINIMRLSAAASGTLYFDTFTPELDMPVRSSRLVEGVYQEPKSLGPQFAVGIYNAHPFVAHDESYVIWDSRREGGFGSSDLYISYRELDGSWGPAINMGDTINTAEAENYPSVSPDGTALFFDRRSGELVNGDRPVAIYWVDAQIIEDLRPKN